MEKVIHKISAVLCALAGIAGLLVAIAVIRLAKESSNAGEMMALLSPDQMKLIPWIAIFCIVYGIACILYAYCRFFWGEENNAFLRFFRKWPVYIAALFAHGMSLVWILPVLFNATYLVRSVSFALGVVGLAAVVIDAQEYLRMLFAWIISAMRTKITKKENKK